MASLKRAHAWAMLGLTLGTAGCGEDPSGGPGTGSGNTTAGNGGSGSGGNGSGASGTTTGTTVSSSAVASSTGPGSGGGPANCDPPPAAGSIWDQAAESYATIDPVKMCIYQGDVLLIVNVAAL